MDIRSRLLTIQGQLTVFRQPSCLIRYQNKASVHEQGQDIARVTSHDFYLGKGEQNLTASLRRFEGGMSHTIVRRRVGWSEEKQQ